MIELNNITKSYNGQVVFENLTLMFEKKKISCILGPSGCGKTTLLNIISKIEKADSGRISGMKDQSVSYIFQELILLPWKTVYDNIAIVLENKYGKKERDPIIRKHLSLVGLDEYGTYFPSQLSGGMRQRVVIARAFAYNSEIILMDEPFSSLDFKLKYGIIESFKTIWQNDRRTVIFVTHDIEEAILLSDVIYVVSSKPLNVINSFKIPGKVKDISNEQFGSLKVKILNALNKTLNRNE